MPPKLLFDISTIDFAQVQYSREEIREINAQRYEFEQLTAIVMFCPEREIIVGSREIGEGEFWERGHVPGNPLFPGVLLIEAAAQLCSFYARKVISTAGFYGLGGVDKVRFRGVVTPGTNVYLLARPQMLTQMRSLFMTQAIVDDRIIFEASVFGLRMPLPTEAP